jgi:hypothetical protein
VALSEASLTQGVGADELFGDRWIRLAGDRGEGQRPHQRLDARQVIDERSRRIRGATRNGELGLRVEARRLDIDDGALLDRGDLRLRHPPQFGFSAVDQIVVASMTPMQREAGREPVRDSKLAAPSGYLRLRLLDFALGCFRGLRPNLVLIERVLRPHLIFEVGQYLRRALLRRRFQDFFALADQALEVLALAAGHRCHGGLIHSSVGVLHDAGFGSSQIQ